VLYSTSFSSNILTTSLGDIAGVTVNNVKVLGGNKNLKISAYGGRDTRENYVSDHYVCNVSINNLTYKNENITQDSDILNLVINSYTKNFTITNDGNAASGADFVYEMQNQNKYSDKLAVSCIN
jgi:hypothetical protein